MLSSQFLTHVQNQAGNRVVLPKVNQKQLCRVPVPVAPADEQIEIARRMNEATETFSELSGFLLDSKSALQKLDQSILAKAFRGELVPQDPADEPAAELLARIAAARAAATKKLNKRTRRPTKQK